MGKNWTTYKKLHKWPGLIISFVLLWYGFSGIIMNHRELLSGIDFNRRIMPSNYEYDNWNNAALKGNLTIGRDSVLVYGNIGIWLTDSTFTNFTHFHEGFPKGIDSRKIFDVLKTPDGSLYAAAFSGLYGFDLTNNRWVKLQTGGREKRFVGLEIIGDTVYALNRSHLFTGRSNGINTNFVIRELEPYPGYDGKVTLFETLWQIHSGEIFGVPGKVYVDLLGIIVIFLSATGIIWFFFPGWIRNRLKKNREPAGVLRTGRWSLRWHNKIGAWTFVLIIIIFLTGIFLRPPLLIAIAQSRVKPLKYSHLDQPNPWYDKMRDLLYDAEREKLFLASSAGIFVMEPSVLKPHAPLSQPPVSVMGITVFEKYPRDGYFLAGSFSGLFLWNPERNEIYDLTTGEPYSDTGMARPVGNLAITGMITDAEGDRYLVDYNSGVKPIGHAAQFPAMPENLVSDSRISFWSLCLELHTGRIFENIVGGFYILIVPLAGLTGIIVVFSGYILWRRKFRKQGYNNLV